MNVLLTATMVQCLLVSGLMGQKAAPSSHFLFGKGEQGDIQVVDIRVPTNGLSPSTYYESIGFRGNQGNGTGNGYAGIQESKDRRGNRVHIFSIWHAVDNPKDKSGFPYVIHLGHGMKSEHFGGEGVGLKTWKLTKDRRDPLYWKTGVWHTHVIRCWQAGPHTRYGFFVRDGKDKVWRLLSVIGVKQKGLQLVGANDAFIEDWEGTGSKQREMHLRQHWRRKSDGDWVAAQKGRFSVNRNDLGKGKRSFQYRESWNAGLKKDSTGDYYFMQIGGRTRPQSPLAFPGKLRAEFELPVKRKMPDHAKGEIESVSLKKQTGQKLAVQWKINQRALPQFSFTLKVKSEDGKVIQAIHKVEPHTREFTIDLKPIGKTNGKLYLTMSIEDLFGNTSEEIRKRLP